MGVRNRKLITKFGVDDTIKSIILTNDGKSAVMTEKSGNMHILNLMNLQKLCTMQRVTNGD